MDRQVIVFLVDRISFEELLAVPEVRALARAGGAALMSPLTAAGDEGAGAYLTIGAGARSVGPEPPVLAFDTLEEFRGAEAEALYRKEHGRDPPPGPFLLGLERYVEANDGLSVPGLLGSVLQGHGRSVAVFGNADTPAGPNRPGVLVGMNRQGSAMGGRVSFGYAPALGRARPLKLLLARPAPDLLGGARTDPSVLQFLALGARLPNPSPYLPAHLTVFDLGDTLRIDTEAPAANQARVERERREAMERLGPLMRRLVERAAARDVLVIVVAPSTSTEMDRIKDEVTPVVMARGNSAELFPEEGAVRTLTSDTTRRDGVVSNEDIAPTVLSFFEIRVPAEMNGSPIREIAAPAPYDLHARHLAHRRMWVPVQVGAAIAVTAVGLLCILLIAARRRLPRALLLIGAALSLGLAPLAVALLAAGHLPRLTYGQVVPFVVVVALLGGLLALLLMRWGTLKPPAAVGLAAVVFLVVEALLSWSGALTPFLGGSELDGVRFYGLPNVFIGVLLGGAVYLAASLRPFAGFALLFAAGLFAGFPNLGANVGGAITLFVAAGLWLAVRTSDRFGWRHLAIPAAVTVAGLAVVVVANVFLSRAPTHVSGFVEGGGLSPLSLLEKAGGRLLVGWRLLIEQPAAWIPVLGLPVCLLVILRGRGAVKDAFDRHPEWRDAMLVLVLASIVAYFVNDTGPAAAGLGFGMAVAGILYLPLVEEPWKPEPVIEEAPSLAAA